MTSINGNPHKENEKIILTVLTLNGLKRGKDFTIRGGQLKIVQPSIRDKLFSIIQKACPNCNFYWETPKILRWF
jgi:hypothetical protein